MTYGTTESTIYWTVSITRFFMKIIGLWYVESSRERLLMRLALGFAVLAILFAILVESVDLYHLLRYRHNFNDVMTNLCASMLLLLILVKLSSFVFYRDKILELIRFAEVNFWNVPYDEVCKGILKSYEKLGMTTTYTFTIIVTFGCFSYIFMPFFREPVGNETKTLPFKLWLDFPYHSPYYEVTYTVQALSTVYSGICTFCFDNFVSTFNMHTAAQLKILNHQVQIVTDDYIDGVIDEKGVSETEAAALTLKRLRKCVRQHYVLIYYVQNLKQAFATILLGQLLLSSICICFSTFQLLTVHIVIERCLYVLYFVGALIQLFFYTWTCNDIMLQSAAISEAAYNSRWYLLPGNAAGNALRKGLIMIMIRARQPCVLTAGNFAVMSLDTFMGILSTSMSYFTLLRQMSGNL